MQSKWHAGEVPSFTVTVNLCSGNSAPAIYHSYRGPKSHMKVTQRPPHESKVIIQWLLESCYVSHITSKYSSVFIRFATMCRSADIQHTAVRVRSTAFELPVRCINSQGQRAPWLPTLISVQNITVEHLHTSKFLDHPLLLITVIISLRLVVTYLCIGLLL